MSIEINTQRLTLIPFGPADHQLFLQLNTDPYISMFIWDDELIDLSTAQEVTAKNDKHFKEDGFGIWKIKLKETAEIIGYTGLWHFFEEPQPQLIYALLKKFTKQGYAGEAAAAIIEYAFNHLGFQYLVAATDEPHTASQRVAQRLGMKFAEKRIENHKPTLFFRIDNLRQQDN